MSYQIEMVRGTTSVQIIRLLEGSEPYILSNDEYLRFGVKEAGYNKRLLINKKFTSADQDPETGLVEFKIMPNETANWPVKTYKYDIGLQSGDDYFVVIPESDLVLKQNITNYTEE
jgi:hypothetical protein